MPIHVFLWFFLRMATSEDPLDGWFPITRVQRRLIHLIAQRIDEGILHDVHITNRLRVENAALESNGRVQKSQVKQELLRRFLARNSGFCGTNHAQNQDMIDFGLVGQGQNMATVAAAHYSAVYWALASEEIKMMMKTNASRTGSFEFPSLAIYHDASDVCGKEVLQVEDIFIVIVSGFCFCRCQCVI